MRKSATRVAIILLLLFFFLAANLVFSPALHAMGPFYRERVGAHYRQSGRIYDLWARLIANHMGKYIAATPRSSGKIYQAPAQ
jgi:hypothetical protein